MKILHINSSDKGGAGIAALRLHRAMLSQGIDSCFMSLDNEINDGIHYVRFNTKKEELVKPKQPLLSFKNYLSEKIKGSYSKALNEFDKKVKFHNEKYNIYYNKESYEIFSTPFSNYDLTESEAYKQADIIHLHWVAGYLDYPSFFENNKKPVVWTIHDENPFRGGFHYKADELRNQGNLKELDLYYKQVKYNAISKQRDLVIVSPSKWLAEEAKQSDVFKQRKVVSIYNTLNTNVFKPLDKNFSRDFFNLPQEAKVFMFASQNIENKRKGFDLLLPIIKKYKENNNVFFLVVGSKTEELIQSNIIFTGPISDERVMTMAYSAADFFVLPSREDNLPNTMLEALACGTPIISFPIGGLKEIVEDNVNGFLAKKVSSVSLANLLESQKIFLNDLISKDIVENSFNMFNSRSIVGQFMDVYRSVVIDS